MKKHMKTVHPWHGLPYGENAPHEVNAFIEVPKNSTLKYELDKQSGFIKLDRVLFSAVHYPGDYGFIPRTISDDSDPTDILILSNFPVYPGTIVKARPIGILEMEDNHEKDEKIIAVHSTDPRFDGINDISDLSKHMVLEIRNFFETYKQLQDKEVKINSVESSDKAKKVILKCIKDYEKMFGDDEE